MAQRPKPVQQQKYQWNWHIIYSPRIFIYFQLDEVAGMLPGDRVEGRVETRPMTSSPYPVILDSNTAFTLLTLTENPYPLGSIQLNRILQL